MLTILSSNDGRRERPNNGVSYLLPLIINRIQIISSGSPYRRRGADGGKTGKAGILMSVACAKQVSATNLRVYISLPTNRYHVNSAIEKFGGIESYEARMASRRRQSLVGLDQLRRTRASSSSQPEAHDTPSKSSDEDLPPLDSDLSEFSYLEVGWVTAAYVLGASPFNVFLVPLDISCNQQITLFAEKKWGSAWYAGNTTNSSPNLNRQPVHRTALPAVSM